MTATPRFSALATLALLVAACGSPSAPPDDRGTPGITIVSGAGASDTIDAIVAQPLIIQVNGGNGRPLANAEVGFVSTAVAEGSDQPTVVITPTRGSGGGTFAIERTDSQGRAAVRVRMGRRAMAGGVVIAVPEVDAVSVAGYTIRAGAPRTITAEPADTAVRVGGSFTLRTAAVDRFGNAAAAVGVVFRALGGPVAAGGGGAVSGSGVGRGAVVAQLGALADTAQVSVVPEGTIAVYTAVAASNEQAAVYTLNLDGSGLVRRVVTTASPGYNATMGTAWSADGARLYFHDSNTDHTRSLYMLELSTGAARRLLATGERMEEEAWPRVSSDGWVYFEGGASAEPLLFRARPDGSERTQVTPREVIGTARHGSPSPDGSRLAFVGSYAQPHPLHVIELADGAVANLGVTALSPRWSRDGAEIVYVASGDLTYGSGPLRAIRPDGTGDRAVTSSASRFAAHFDFSPDGRYIIAATDQGVLTLVDYATGAEMPVRIPSLAQRLLAPSWRP